MGSLMKLYDDRQFCNGHRIVTMGSPVGYLVLGDIGSEVNLETVIKARADVGGNFLAGVAADAAGVLSLADMLAYAIENRIKAQKTFYGVGGAKIFRDLIWLMQGIMREDHKFFKSHKMYDFPQRKRGTMIKMRFAGRLLANKKIRAKIGPKLSEIMVEPYKTVIEEAKKKG